MSALIARGAETVTRNSIYRAGYELLYAPLPPDQKRPTKVVLDVGADKLGDHPLARSSSARSCYVVGRRPHRR